MRGGEQPGGGVSAISGSGSWEARPRVGGAGCAGPTRLRVRGSGIAARPGRCGWPLGTGGVPGQRCALPGPGRPRQSFGNFHTPTKGREAFERREAAGTKQGLAGGTANSVRTAQSAPPAAARGALGAAATHAPPTTARLGVPGRLPCWRGAGGRGLRGGLSRERAVQGLAAEGLQE